MKAPAIRFYQTGSFAVGNRLLGIEQRRLRRLRSVKVRVETAVEQVDGLEIDSERSFFASSEKLLGDRHPVVMRDQDGRADALVGPHSFDDVRLLVQRVVVVGRLFRGAEAEEVEQQQGVILGEARGDLGPVV